MIKQLSSFFLAWLCVQLAVAQNTYVKQFVGNGTAGFVNGDSLVTRLKSPFGITTDKQGNVYIAENGNNCIRMITPSGVSSIFAGTGSAGFQDGAASGAKFNAPTGVCVDDSGNVFVADFQNHRIRKITRRTMMVSTVSGSGVAGFKNHNNKDSVQFNYPRGICLDSKGNLYVGDSWNHRIRIVSLNGAASTYAGSGNIFGVQSVSGYKDGYRDTAVFYTPCEVKMDAANNLYVADAYNHRIRKVSISGMVSTVCGSGASGSSNGGFADGPVATARLNTPVSLFVTTDGQTIYIGDGANNRVRKAENAMLETIAGTGVAGFQDGVGNVATFNFPRGIAVNPANKNQLYVVDYNNNAVRKLYLNYTVGVNNLDIEQGVSLYPNPSKGSFIIKSAGFSQPVELKIWSLTGVLVFKQLMDKGLDLTIDTHLPAGVYCVQLAGDNINKISRLVIE